MFTSTSLMLRSSQLTCCFRKTWWASPTCHTGKWSQATQFPAGFRRHEVGCHRSLCLMSYMKRDAATNTNNQVTIFEPLLLASHTVEFLFSTGFQNTASIGGFTGTFFFSWPLCPFRGSMAGDTAGQVISSPQGPMWEFLSLIRINKYK